MFKTVIKSVINIFERVSSILKQTYDETYGCEELMREANKRAEEIKNKNKQEFIRHMQKFAEADSVRKTGIQLPSMISLEIAKDMFKKAKAFGELDILNNLVEPKEKGKQK